MSIDKQTKDQITKKHQLHKKDTGSADVQIALHTETIQELNEHLALNPHDSHSRLNLLKVVGRRRKLLNYLSTTNVERYQAILKKLNLKK